MKDLFSTGAISHFQTNVVVCVVIILTSIVFNALATVTVKDLKNEHQTHIRFLISRLVRYGNFAGCFACSHDSSWRRCKPASRRSGRTLGGCRFCSKRSYIKHRERFCSLIAERPFSVGDLIQVGDIEEK